MPIKAIIFDFDGLIIDTETPDYDSWNQVFTNHDAHLSLDEWLPFVGQAVGAGGFDPYALPEERSGQLIDRQRIRQQRRSHYRNIVDRQPILPGVEETISEAQSLDLGLAIASSSDRKWVTEHLSKRNMLQHFAAIYTRDDVARAKPAPDLYLAAIRALDVAPHEALAFEDSRNGMLAAKRAGLVCVAVPNTMTQSLDFTEADLILNSLLDYKLTELFKQF